MKNHNEHHFSTQATLKPQILMMKSRMSTQWIRWEAGGEARSTKIIKFYETNQISNPIIQALK